MFAPPTKASLSRFKSKFKIISKLPVGKNIEICTRFEIGDIVIKEACHEECQGIDRKKEIEISSFTQYHKPVNTCKQPDKVFYSAPCLPGRLNGCRRSAAPCFARSCAAVHILENLLVPDGKEGCFDTHGKISKYIHIHILYILYTMQPL